MSTRELPRCQCVLLLYLALLTQALLGLTISIWRREKAAKKNTERQTKKVRFHPTMHLNSARRVSRYLARLAATTASISFLRCIYYVLLFHREPTSSALYLYFFTLSRSGEKMGIRLISHIHTHLCASRHCVSVAHLIHRRQATAKQQTFHTNAAHRLRPYIRNMTYGGGKTVTKGHIDGIHDLMISLGIAASAS